LTNGPIGGFKGDYQVNHLSGALVPLLARALFYEPGFVSNGKQDIPSILAHLKRILEDSQKITSYRLSAQG
jgi:hypothetical protein